MQLLRPGLTARSEHHAAGAQNIRQAGSQTDAHRRWRLSPRPSPRTRPTRRSGHERSSHLGIEKRAPAHARCRFKRENGGFWRYQFCTEVARPKRFELLTTRFVVCTYWFAAIFYNATEHYDVPGKLSFYCHFRILA